MQNVIDMRVKQLNIRLSDEEAERLERVAKHYGLNAAGVIRFLLKRADDAIAEHAHVRAHGQTVGGLLAAVEEAADLVERADLPAVRDDGSDVDQKRYGLVQDGRVIAKNLDLEALQRTLGELKPKLAPAKSRAKKR